MFAVVVCVSGYVVLVGCCLWFDVLCLLVTVRCLLFVACCVFFVV